ncbi:hypothetical protein O181_017539 [Austropuccinia psidii MF-1]|uniref:Uncharacterized protein n=1 Tax=Austropuccinia psidii MF-1 TaxID=1389203 RepID=A0A9Q3C3L5_9BASI|nr:hypothetical protein [Austropuccinia psidii MF-1]
MELIDYIDGLFIDVPRIPDYWITSRLNTEFKGHASIWYTEMKEIPGRRNWPWWKNKIIQKSSNGKEKAYAIEKVPEEESPTEDSDSDSMGDAIREQSDEEQDPTEEFLVEYQKEPPLEIWGIQLEEGMPQDTANKTLCKHTQDAQPFLVTPTNGMANLHGTATKITFCIDNAQHQLIIDSGAYCSIVARNYLDNHFPNWEKQLLPTKAKNLKISLGKMPSIGQLLNE